jgi:hypothetical protein
MFDQISVPRLVRDLTTEDIVYIVNSQLNLANYLHRPEELPIQPDRVYVDNSQLWQDVLARRLRANITLKLQNFLLCDWFPRSPGLFYTEQAQWSREEAMHFVESAPSSTPPNIDDAEPSGRYGSGKEERDFTYIFNPYGKLSMLKGGIGSVRLRNKQIRQGDVWFVSASSTPTAHEGFPIALPDHLYQRYFEQMDEAGFLPSTLLGKLYYLPDELLTLYRDYSGVPQLYLLVEDVEPVELEVQRPFSISVAVSFTSSFENRPQMYAAYVTFYPQKPGSFERRVEWLAESYVHGRYQGQINTDFDEREFHFSNVVFSLDKVMNGRVNPDEVQQWLQAAPHHSYGPSRFLHDMEQTQQNLQVLQILRDQYSLEEFRDLCFKIDIRYDHLGGEALPGKARELLIHCQQRNRIPALIKVIRQERPHLPLSQ